MEIYNHKLTIVSKTPLNQADFERVEHIIMHHDNFISHNISDAIRTDMFTEYFACPPMSDTIGCKAIDRLLSDWSKQLGDGYILIYTVHRKPSQFQPNVYGTQSVYENGQETFHLEREVYDSHTVDAICASLQTKHPDLAKDIMTQFGPLDTCLRKEPTHES